MLNTTKETARDLENREDIIDLVDAFYQRIREDAVLGPIFERQVGDRWDSHLETMYDFWDSILFRTGTFRGNPPLKHRLVHEDTPLDESHFARWLELFDQTLNQRFTGPKALFAQRAAADIAQVLQRKIKESTDPTSIQFQ